MDMLTPTSTKPDICSTPGVVSHTPEFFTTLKLELNPSVSSSLRTRDGGSRLRREETKSRLEGTSAVTLIERNSASARKKEKRMARILKESLSGSRT